MEEPPKWSLPETLLSPPEFLPPERLRPRKSVVVAALGLVKRIPEKIFLPGKLGVAFSLALAIINMDPAVAFSPAVPPEPTRNFSSLSITVPLEAPVSRIVSREQAFVDRLPERIKTLEKIYPLEGHPNLEKELVDLARAESDFELVAESSKNAVGTMQSTVIAAKEMVMFLEKKMGSKAAWEFLRTTYGVNTASDVNFDTLKANQKFNEAVGDFYYQKCFDYVLVKIPGTSGWERVKNAKFCYFLGPRNYEKLVTFAKSYSAPEEAEKLTADQLLAFGKLEQFNERGRIPGWEEALGRYSSK